MQGLTLRYILPTVLVIEAGAMYVAIAFVELSVLPIVWLHEPTYITLPSSLHFSAL